MTGSPLALHVLFMVGPVPITAPVVVTWALMAALGLAARLTTRSLSVMPSRGQAAIELIVVAIADQIRATIRVAPGRYLPLIGTLFLFILSSNLLGVVPTFEAPTMFIYVTVGCALVSFCYYNFQGMRVQGPIGYVKHFWGPVWFIGPFMLLIEIISHLIRPMSLSIRLYANMYAGDQVTENFFHLAPVLLPVPTILLHIFVSLIQAFIFTMLSVVYVGAIVAHEDH